LIGVIGLRPKTAKIKGRTKMALVFPNRSRSFDEIKNGVRFTGYDGMFEVKFLVEASALKQTTAARCLSAFDSDRASVLEAAAKLYERRRSNNLTLSLQDMA
jgi:hypothetical protein